MKHLYAIVLSLAVLASPSLVEASHVAGGYFTYECVGADQYLITLNLFRDCDGITLPATQTISLQSSCGTFTLSAPRDTSFEVSQVCSSINTTCNGGTFTGIELHQFSALATLPPCDDWQMSWSVCCRNASSNVPTSLNDNMYVYSSLDNTDPICNSSVQWGDPQIRFACVNTPVTWPLAITDVDGDDLQFSLIAGKESAILDLIYGTGFTPSEPIPGITIDPMSGVMQFTPTMIGNYIVAVQIEQFNNGILVGTQVLDVQVVVESCSNQVPSQIGGILDNLSGTALQTGPSSIVMCEGNDLCFDWTIVEPDSGQVLFVTNNAQQQLPGSVVNVSGTDTVIVTVCWTAGVGSAGSRQVILNASDSICPLPGQLSTAVSIQVVERTTAQEDAQICGDQVAPLIANGGSSFVWSVLPTIPPGDPIIVGQNFSCDTCASTIASPMNTTSYVVTSNLQGCLATDTVTVSVVPDVVVNATTSNAVSCFQEVLQFNTSITPLQPGTAISWDNLTGLSDPTIADPTATFIFEGPQQYIVTVTSVDGCVKQDTLDVYFNDFQIGANVQNGPHCVNTDRQLDVTVLPNLTGLSYQWSPSAGLSDDTIQDPLANLPTAGQYTFVVTVTSDVGCSAIDSVTFDVVPEVTLILPVDTVQNTGGTLFLSGGIPTGGTWSGNGVLVGNAWSANQAGAGWTVITYTVQVGNCVGSAQDSIYVVPTPGMEELFTIDDLSVVPNPSSTIINLLGDLSGVSDAQLIDASGRSVMQWPMNGRATSTLDVSEVPPGRYVLLIRGAGRLGRTDVTIVR